MLDQINMAKKMMSGMSPGEIKDLMRQAKESKNMFDKQIQQAIDKEIKDRQLVSRNEVEEMFKDMLSKHLN